MPTEKTKKNRGNIQNLKMWKPGQSGNPKGRPKGAKSLNDVLRRIGDEPLEEGGMTKREAVMRKVYKLAFEGKAWAVQFIANRTEGKEPQTINFNHREMRQFEEGESAEDYVRNQLSASNGE